MVEAYKQSQENEVRTFIMSKEEFLSRPSSDPLQPNKSLCVNNEQLGRR